jgi:hypothetical protein
MLAVVGFSRGQLFRARLLECAVLWLSALGIGIAAALHALAPLLAFSGDFLVRLFLLSGMLMTGGLASATLLVHWHLAGAAARVAEPRQDDSADVA